MAKKTSSQDAQSAGSSRVDEGWVKIYRELLRKPIWKQSTPEQKSILVTLILMADHKPQEWDWKGEKFNTKPGQFITSLESISRKAGKGISIQNVRGSLKRFSKKFDFLTDESTKTGRLITINNWGTYQPNKENPTDKSTVAQQRGNKEVTPNKNERMKETNKNLSSELRDERAYHVRLTNYFRKKILLNNPTYRFQASEQKWDQVFERMIRLDKRHPESIKNIIRWVQQDEFWMANCLSPSKLREKYDELSMKMERAVAKGGGNIKPTTYRQCQDAERRALAEKALEARRAERNDCTDNLRIKHDVPVRGEKPKGNGALDGTVDG
jgi:hypothetical protein